MKFYSKETFNLRRNTKKFYVSILIFIIGGMIFFIGSGFVFEEEPPILASPTNKKIDIGSVKYLTIYEWIYDKDKNEMRVIIDAHDIKSDYDKLHVNAFQRSDGKEIKSNIDYDFENNIVVNIKGLDDEFEQVALDLIGSKKQEIDDMETENLEENTSDNENENITTLYADQRKINLKEINHMTKQDMAAYLTSIMVENDKKEISQKEKSIKQFKEKIDDMNNEINDIEEEKAYMTNEEKVDASNDINALETSKKDTKRDIDSLKNDIKNLKDHIEKLQVKQRDIETQ